MKNSILLSVALVFLAVCGCNRERQETASSKEKVRAKSYDSTVKMAFAMKHIDMTQNEVVLLVGRDTLVVELAVTPVDRSLGLMFRDSLPENHGMLFVFDVPGKYAFWMKNTTIPLSIAFIDENGVITEIEDMEPLTDTLHVPDTPILYALEVNQGWFERHGVDVGDTIRFLPSD